VKWKKRSAVAVVLHDPAKEKKKATQRFSPCHVSDIAPWAKGSRRDAGREKSGPSYRLG